MADVIDNKKKINTTPADREEDELMSLREELKNLNALNRSLEIEKLQSETRAIEKQRLKQQIEEEKKKYEENIKKLQEFRKG